MYAKYNRQVTQLYSDNRSPLEKLLSRFERYKETAPGQGMVICPAHDDKSPSLSIKELDDGRLLMHCFAGCETHDIMASIGLSLSDLYPEQLAHHRAPTTAHQRRRYGQSEHALAALAHEALIVTLAAETGIQRGTLSDVDMGRLKTALNRIRSAYEVAGNPLPKREART